MDKPVIVDHFCGGGGESTGIMQACGELGMDVQLHAVNHWERAIETHSINHPEAEHYATSIDALDPCTVVPGRRVEMMWASPECTHFSTARGGRPCSDQSRASAWLLLKWLQELYVPRLIVENVPEFLGWGPLGADGRPLKSKRGEVFHQWVRCLEALGYRVEWRVLNCADYGAPTTRRRLFVQAVRGRKRIVWPAPSHAEAIGEAEQLIRDERKPWVAAREVIDWSLESPSIRTRRRPLAAATLRRIEHGIRKYWGDMAEPFLVVMRGTGKSREVSRALPAITASGNHLGLVQPLLIPQHGGGACRQVAQPCSTVATAGAIGLVEPFVIANGQRSSMRLRSIDEPLSTVVTKQEHCLVEPLLVEYYGNGQARPVGDPVGTVTCRDRFALVQGCPYTLDIGFRMLQPHELAAAQSFPEEYRWAGTKTEVVKQVGNAVPPRIARALALAALGGGVS